MKLLYIDPMSYHNLGEYDLNLLNALTKEDLEICFACNKKILEEYDLEDFSNLKLLPFFNYEKAWGGVRKGVSYAISLFGLMNYANKEKPNIIHLQWAKLPLIDIFFIVYFRILKVPVIYTSHNFVAHEKNIFSYLFSRTICKCVNKVIVHTETTKSEIVRSFGCASENVFVVHHGPLSTRSVATTLLARQEESPSVCNESIKLCILGSIRRNKGVIDYLRLWEIANQSFPEIVSQASLHITGQWNPKYLSEVEKFLESCSAKNIYIANRWLSDEEFYCEMINSDICILPYKNISQSGILMTLISHKKPFIVADVGGLSDPLRIGKVGWSFSWQESDEVKAQEGIINPIQEFTSGWRPTEEDWLSINTHFSWSMAGKLTLDVYKLALKSI